MTLTLRPYQRAAIDAIYQYYEQHTGNALLCIPTAGGKSLVMATFVEGVLKVRPGDKVAIAVAGAAPPGPDAAPAAAEPAK